MSALSTYIPRIVDRELQQALCSMGGVLIEGPRACGKTITGRHHAASEVLLDVDHNARRLVSLEPSLVLKGDTPRLLDEWQLEPGIWNHVRRAIDERRSPGQFILTGSSQPTDETTRHSGAGRIGRIRMRPLSLFESGIGTGSVSLNHMLNGGQIAAEELPWSLADLAEAITRGGWPAFRDLDSGASMNAVSNYLEEIKRVDVSRLGGVAHDPVYLDRVLRSLARNTSTTVTIATILSDVSGESGPKDPDTVSAYLDTLERIMIVENQPAWAPSLRSRSRLRKAPKRHFVDPSLAVAALGASPERMIADLEYMGFLFESLMIRDLRIHAQAADARVYHYRDNTDLEVDAVVEARDGRWAAFEIKLGDKRVDEAARALKTFQARIDANAPGFLGVIVSSGYSYMRPDGVAVIAARAIGP